MKPQYLCFYAFLVLVCIGESSTLHGPAWNLADKLFLERKDLANAERALELYQKLAENDEENPEILWRISMACQFLGLRRPQMAAKLYHQGKNAGWKASQNAPNCAPCHFWTAINMALYGETVGPIKVLFTLPTIKMHLQRVLELDPSYAKSGAFRVLGMIDWKLPGILGGDNKRAQNYFLEAYQRAPSEPLNQLFLAKFLISQDNVEQLRGVLSAPAELPAENDVESYEAYTELTAIRQTIMTTRP